MNPKYDKDIDALLDKAASASGNDRSRLDSVLSSNPQLASMLSKMKSSDIEKLGRILSDKEQTQRILSSPQARQLMRSLGLSGKDGGK
ncbi:MAG: hypothetical protein IJC18_02365 [Clostridia bacterium]|nr:hypothetical protein [Clostridia bacterium]MBQ9993250.1 hypothetical protein [Clostridia bacterium]